MRTVFSNIEMTNQINFFLQKIKQGKTIFTSILSVLLFSITSIFAGTNNNLAQTEASKWMSKESNKGFIENNGQLMDMDGNAVPFVLFKTEAPGFNFWITTNGITLQTLQLRKEPIPEYELNEIEKQEVKATGKSKSKKYFDWERIDVELKNANIKKENIVKEAPTSGHSNYFFPHCPDGIYGVKVYEKITIKDVYPGIDWVFYRKADGTLKYDFVVHPGANYKKIELLYKSKTPIKINKQGELELYTQYGNVKENTPVSFYNGEEVKTRFIQHHQTPIKVNEDKGYETSISFNLSLPPSGGVGGGPLIIDPQLTWATFFGGNGTDGPYTIETDNNDNIFIAGYTSSANFPVQNAGTYFQGTRTGVIGDVFILKLNNSGVPQWATYYGGSDQDEAFSIAIDNAGNVFITGYTLSSNFPVQNAGTFYQPTYGGVRDAFILKFDNAGNRLWATYYGGSAADHGGSITTDAAGNVFVTGPTTSTDILTQPAGTFYQGTYGGVSDVYILKFSNTGNLLWGTYCGGSSLETAHAITTDLTGNVFITGYTGSSNFPIHNAGTFFQGANAGITDVFVLKFSNAGTMLWGTLYGGTGNEQGCSIIADATGNVFVAGYTASTNFPVQTAGTFFQGLNAGGQDIFLLKFDNLGNRLWATYYGGTATDNFLSYDNLAMDGCETVYLSFETLSSGLPTMNCDGGYVNSVNSGNKDIFITRFANNGDLLWATYIGGNGLDFRSPVTVDSRDNLIVSGEWTEIGTVPINPATYPLVDPGGSALYNSTFNGGNDDGFILKFGKQPMLTNIIDAWCMCNGEAALTQASGCAPLQYKWYDTNWTIIGTDSFVTNLCQGNYAVEVKDALCSIDTVLVYIDTTAVPVKTTTLSASICLGKDHMLPGGTLVTAAGTYRDTMVSHAGCDSVLITVLTVDTIQTIDTVMICTGDSAEIHGQAQSATGLYSQTSAAADGCDSISWIQLVYYPEVIAEFDINPNPASTNKTVLFTDQSVGATEWYWSFGDVSSSFSTRQNPSFIYTEFGDFEIQLIVNDIYGCSDTITKTITIEPEFVFYTPNTFTPDGDGLNDDFFPKATGMAQDNFVFYIYDRWGNLIFQSSEPGKSWDGRANGGRTVAQTDVYVWLVRCQDNNGIEHIYTGHVNLLQ